MTTLPWVTRRLTLLLLLPAPFAALPAPLARFTRTGTVGGSAFSPSHLSRHQTSPTRQLAAMATLRGGTTLRASADSGSDPAPTKTPLQQWATLGALFFVYISNQWSRSLIYYLVSFSGSPAPGEFMNVDLGFDQTQYGLLASFGFTLLFAVSSLFAGRVVDTNDKALVTVVSCVVWSLATIATGFAPGFLFVLAFRVIQGISQGFTNPASFALLSETFPQQRRATANALYSSGIYVGGGLASLSILLVSQAGWRSACVTVGCVGLVAAVVAAVVLKSVAPTSPLATTPAKTAAKAETKQEVPLTATIQGILSTAPVAWLFVASAIRFCAGFGIGVWAAPFFREAFPEQQALYAVTNAVVVGVGGFTSSLVGGAIADRLTASKADGSSADPAARAWLMAASCALAIPAWAAVVTAPTFAAAMTFLLLEYLVAECWFGPAVAIIQDCTPASQRGTAQGLFSMLTTVGNIAPVAIGAALTADVSLRNALLLSVPTLYAGAAVAFVATGYSLRQYKQKSG